MRPTKEDQDEYFRLNSLDPWGYESPIIQARLDRSLRFIQRFVSPSFDGVFVEVGAFNGHFSRKLAAAFPAASIAASDLVKASWEAEAAKQPFPVNVGFQWCDMMDFDLPAQHSGKPAVLLLMECLYYLPAPDRPRAVAHLRRSIPNLRHAFVSAPIDEGTNYFAERDLLRLMKPLGRYKDSDPHISLFERLLKRRKPSGQVIYCFKAR